MRNNPLWLMAALCLVAGVGASQAATPPPETPATPPAASTGNLPVLEAGQEPDTIIVTELPADVQDYLVNLRLCTHFRRPEADGGHPLMAAVTCGKSDETVWHSLRQKHADNANVNSVLLAERPDQGATGKEE